ncbi:hypothetical protein TOPH_06726 [Tolypocladium ophioglossoides CBS 100239]|uniref:Extracellular membrane protein CFEM domain-containing protein n=1 Tax=Tolypocladium ophioglossoides (strain CBS 100239) TaxID=1163406 RepID=A0A0L0N3P9_TOLOC|nr:hypothetical protein TOPH_06726 [Tolypocladium ophioglossoides CBS 100239]
MARPRIRSAAPLLLLLLLASSCLALQSDFSFYPQNAQPCLNQASNATNCQGNTAAQINTCLCSNQGGFITNTAKCLGQSDNADVQKVYTTMLQACTDSHTPMSVSQSDFLAAANGSAVSTTTTTSATAKVTTTGGVVVTIPPTPTPTETGAADKETQGSGGLSTGTTVGIAVGASAVGLAALAGLAFFLVRRRKRRTQEEAHPMLSQYEYHSQTPTTFPPTEPSSGFSRFSGAESKADGWSPAYKSPGPYTGPYAGPPAASVAELPPQGAMHGHGHGPSPSPGPGPGHGAYEMVGSIVPLHAVEMPGSEPPPRHPMGT